MSTLTLPTSPTSGVPLPKAAQPGAPLSASTLLSGSIATATPGKPSSGPSAGPTDPTPVPVPGPGPGPTPVSGPAPTPTPAPDTITTGDAFATTAASSFFDLIRNASSPDALQAQNIILRRIALEGDVVNSRVPAPRNITEIGGYLNILTEWNELEMRSQVLAGILGVAGPNPPLGWTSPSTALGFRPMINDRPAGAAQSGLPVTVMIRNDFFDPLSTAILALHAQGCSLPLLSGPLALPTMGGTGTALLDPLDYLGRILRIAPSQALVDPATDPIALVRPNGGTGPFTAAARSLGAGTVPVPLADYEALQQTGATLAAVPLAAAPLVDLTAALATAGFAPSAATLTPGGTPSDAWSRFANIGGLIVDQTRLGDELSLLHDRTEIAASIFAGMQDWRWRGTAFKP